MTKEVMKLTLDELMIIHQALRVAVKSDSLNPSLATIVNDLYASFRKYRERTRFTERQVEMILLAKEMATDPRRSKA